MDRILRSATSSVSIALYNADGTPSTGLSITASIADSAGTVVESGLVAVESSGTYTITPAPLSILDVYTVTWDLPGTAERTTEFEVVGAFLFAVAELRAFATEVSSTTEYPQAKVVDAREKAEEALERFAQVALRPRGRRVSLDGTGRDTLVLPDPKPIRMVSVIADGATFSAGDVAELVLGLITARRPNGAVWPWGTGNVEVLYEHGYSSPPAPVRQAAMQLALMRLVGDARPSRAVSEVTEVGLFRLSIADPSRQRWTGIPDVDAVIAEYGIHSPL